MLKRLILFFWILAVTITSFAENSKMEDKKFYLKAAGDRGFFQNSKLPNRELTLKYKNHSPINSVEVGGGYYFNDEFRGELLLHHELNNKFIAIRNTPLLKTTKTSKNDLSAMIFNMNMNVVDFDYGNIFLSGGVGIARVKETIHYNVHSPLRNLTLDLTSDRGYKGKRQNNFAYGLGFGLDFKFSERLHAEIAYRYSDYGRTRALMNTRGQQIGKTTLRSHNALIGLRADI